METLSLIIYMIISIALIAVVLLQSGKSAGLGSIAGGAEAVFGKRKGLDDFLEKLTIGLGALFMLLALLITIILG